jgi:hypothetical protein
VVRSAANVVHFENGKLAEHWDVLHDEATRAQSTNGLPCSAIRSRPDRKTSTDLIFGTKRGTNGMV